MQKKVVIFLTLLICICILFPNNSPNDTNNHTKVNRKKCKGEKCVSDEKKEIRKKIFNKLQAPLQTAPIYPIYSKLQDVEELWKKQEIQINVKNVKLNFEILKKFVDDFNINNLITIPTLPDLSYIISTQNQKKSTDISTILKLQQLKYDIIQYLTHTKYTIDSFWHMVKKIIFNDPHILITMKQFQNKFCSLPLDLYNKKLLSMSGEINFSPIIIPLKHSQKLALPISIGHYKKISDLYECKHIEQLNISESNDICTNLLILNNIGTCILNKLNNKIFKCVKSHKKFTNVCKNYQKLLNKFHENLIHYLNSARFIIHKQILPLYFAAKLSNRLQQKVSDKIVYFHFIYKDVIENWIQLLLDLQTNLPDIKEKVIKVTKHYNCESFNKNIVDYLDSISNELDKYIKISSNLKRLEKLNKMKEYKEYLHNSFTDFLHILTKETNWIKHLTQMVRTNVDKKNALCVFKVVRFVLSEIYNNSKQFYEIGFNDLLFFSNPIYRTYANLVYVEESDFSFKELFNIKNISNKFKEFATLDYKLLLMFSYFNAKKCAGSIDSIDGFLKQSGYSDVQIKTIKCLLNNKGNVRHCQDADSLEWIERLLDIYGISNYSIEEHDSIVRKLDRNLSTKKVYEIFEEYKVCCHRNCVIPDYCNNTDIKNFCRECDNKDKESLCKDNDKIYDTIKECCFRGIIQNIDANNNEYDPCKLGYKVINNVFRWEYPEWRCSMGTNEQKKCYNLLNNIGKLTIILKQLLEDTEGNLDNGKEFCSNPKEKIDRLCCNNIKVCQLCKDINKEYVCHENIPSILVHRRNYENSLRELTNDDFMRSLKKKIKTYYKKGFNVKNSCDALK